MAVPATPLPRLNQRLEVSLLDRGAAQCFSRLVQETVDTLRISLPELEGRSFPVSEGNLIRVWYTGNGGYWCLEAEVLSVFRHDGETLVEISRRGNVHRAQRRNHVRVDVALLAHLTLDQLADVPDGAESSDERTLGTRISGITRNMSGGGVSLRTSRRVFEGDRGTITFYLPEHGGEISGKARIVHVKPDPEREGHFIVACMFDRMAISDRERIIRYLFFRQRELAARRKVGAR